MSRRLLAILLACVAALVSRPGGDRVDAAQQPTFSTRRETVRVDVLVTDAGRPVRNLQPADFEILDAGVPQRVDFLSVNEVPLNVALVFDTSHSIDGERLRHLREGAQAVLDSLRRDDQAGLLTFTNAVIVRERLTPAVDVVRAAVDRLQAATDLSGGTALIDATYTAMTMLDGDVGRGLLIVFTDGVDTSSWLPADRVLAAARRSDAVTYAVATTPLRRESFLRELAGATGGDAVDIQSSAALRSTFVRILEEFRQRYLVGFSPEGVAVDGWHPLTVRVANRRLTVRARPGYMR